MTSIFTASQIPLAIDLIGPDGKLSQPWVHFLNHLETSLPAFGVSYVLDETAEIYAPLRISQGLSITRSPDPIPGAFFISIDTGELFVGTEGSWVLQSHALTGDLSKPAGSTIVTLNTVNSTTGTFGAASEVPVLTVNGKGLITAVEVMTVIADAETLSGDFLAPNVLDSSLTSVGVLELGTWEADPVGIPFGGTGATTAVDALNALLPDQTGQANKFLQTDGSTATWIGGAVGTVTSVGAAGNQGITISGSPITSAGTITFGLGAITPTSVAASGSVTGSNLSGTNTGDQTSVTGNAGTATALQTPRTINGTAFDGTTNITITTDAGTLTGGTLAAGVTGSSLTSVGVLSSLSSTGVIQTAVNGAAADPYGAISVTNPAGIASYSYFGLTRVASIGYNIGIDTSNRLFIGSGTGGYTGNVASRPLTIDSSGNLITSGTLAASNLSGTNTGNQTITLTGDATGSGTGSFAVTLATVNSNVGSFGSSTSIPTITVNGKGLITAASGNVVIAPAGTLTGTTLASNVVTSSLTSVGTLANLTVTNPITGSVTGSAASATGNAATATVLQTARTINGVSFNGSANITVSQIKVGTLSRTMSDASGSVAYTGVGFTPTSIEFHGSVDTVNEFCIGYGSAAGSRCMTSDGTGAKFNSADAIRVIRSSAGNEAKATIASMDADGFTLAWTKVGSPPGNSLVVNYIARR